MKAIIFIAPPGAGKSTQADIFSRIFNMHHLDASRVLQESLAKMNADDEIVKKALSDYKEGRLMDPVFVADIIFKEIESIFSQGKNIVFSGSFRTLYEAERGLPLLDRIIGRENIHIFNINISQEESIDRNISRRVCEKNRHSIPGYESFKDKTECPFDGSKLIKRSTDNPEVAKFRYEVYANDTQPVLDYMRANNYEIVNIDGHANIDEVTFSILAHLQLHPL